MHFALCESHSLLLFVTAQICFILWGCFSCAPVHRFIIWGAVVSVNTFILFFFLTIHMFLTVAIAFGSGEVGIWNMRHLVLYGEVCCSVGVGSTRHKGYVDTLFGPCASQCAQAHRLQVTSDHCLRRSIARNFCRRNANFWAGWCQTAPASASGHTTTSSSIVWIRQSFEGSLAIAFWALRSATVERSRSHGHGAMH